MIALLLSLTLAACAGETPEETTAPESVRPAEGTSIPFRPDGSLSFLRGAEQIVEIAIEVAETDSARARGLMQRAGLPERSGMLFVFDREEEQNFWMANTPLSLDIYFVSADSQIVNIAKYTRPLSQENVSSIDPARYVIETAAGFADSHGIVEGDRVRWRLSGR